MEDADNWYEVIERLRGAEYRVGLVTASSPTYRVEFAPGLTDAEFKNVQRSFGFRFPPDLRALLREALPIGPQFPDWRCGDVAVLREWLDLPLEGLLFDVEHNGFWLDEWGARPQTTHAARDRITALVASAPPLIPVFAHRMMPDEPHAPGNPVFSVHQTDIIHSGVDLADYLHHEFGLPGRQPRSSEPRPIRFWDPTAFGARISSPSR